MKKISEYGICDFCKERDIAEKVFFIAFLNPGKYKTYEMDKLIFGGYKNRVYRAIKKMGCESAGCISRKLVKGKRGNEQLIYANFDKIKTRIIELANFSYDEGFYIAERDFPNDFDWYVLEQKFTSPFFIWLLKRDLESIIKDQSPGFDPVKYMLSWFDILLIQREQSPGLQKLSIGIETKDQYADKIQKVKQKIKTLKSKDEWLDVTEIFKSVSGNKEESEKYSVKFDFTEQYILFYILPQNTIDNFKWLSDMGKKYYSVMKFIGSNNSYESKLCLDFIDSLSNE